MSLIAACLCYDEAMSLDCIAQRSDMLSSIARDSHIGKYGPYERRHCTGTTGTTGIQYMRNVRQSTSLYCNEGGGGSELRVVCNTGLRLQVLE